jgi:hypothetical protein
MARGYIRSFMNKIIAVLILSGVALMSILPQAFAQHQNTGNDLMAGCRAAEAVMADNKLPSSPILMFDAGLCIGHLNTALFYLNLMKPDQAGHPQKTDICIPENVTVTQFLGVLNKYIRERPERRSDLFNDIIVQSAMSVWLCNNAK